MKIEKIKPTPKYMLSLIEKVDKRANIKPCGQVRYYSYLTKNDGELVKVTCAVKVYKNKWYCKQVAVHGLHSKDCFCKDIEYSFMGGYKVGFHAEGMYTNRRWFEDGKWYTAEDKYFNPYAHLVNPEYPYKIPQFKYSACELYKGDDIIHYLRIYEKYPQAEYLVKLGLSNYALSKQILVKCAKDKQFRKWIARHREEIASPCYYVSTILNAYKQGESPKTVQAIEYLKKELCLDRRYAPIRNMLNGDYKRYSEYLKAQKIYHASYLDYLTACNYLGLDMSEDKNRYPHDFKHWHDVRTDEYATAKALKDKEERKELYSKFALIAEKYLPLQYANNGQFIVVIAKSPAELIREGEMLHHCVGRMNYDQKFIREETLIFFIRDRETPDLPLVTVEYSLKKKQVLQCYADHDTKPDDAILQYVNNTWLPYANKTLKKIAA